MTPYALLFAFLAAASSFGQGSPSISAYDAVNPFIGTAADGNTFLAATLPFGMIQWGPDTRADGWYHYQDKTIRGFSLTHISGAGCPIYADVPILPWTGELPAGSPGELSSTFSHDKEQAHPGYYLVEFINGVKTELTTADRSGIARFTLPAVALRTFLFKAGDSATIPEDRKGDASTVEFRGNDTLVGTVHSGGFCNSDSNYVLYFVVKFSKPFTSSGTWDERVHAGNTSVTGRRAGAYVSFPPGSDSILLRVGLSFVSIENAQANLQAEIPAWDFDAVHAAATNRWKQTLARLQADGSTPEQRTIFVYRPIPHAARAQCL